jgi:hypothetical protein
MFGQFKNDSLRKYTIAFGTLFNDISIVRENSSGARVQTIKVPLAYGPKERFIVRRAQDPNLDQDVAISLPRISFERTGLFYDGSRTLPRLLKNAKVQSSDSNKLLTQFAPVPYTINFSLYSITDNQNDSDQIAEQIFPYFRPEWTVALKLIPDMALTYDIPIILESSSFEDVYEGDFNSRRTMVWTFNFAVKGWFFSPIERTGVIKRVQVDFHIPQGNSAATFDIDNAARVERILVQPGQLANGAPTANIDLTVAYGTIEANSEWKFIQQIFHYDDGYFFSYNSGLDNPKDN